MSVDRVYESLIPCCSCLEKPYVAKETGYGSYIFCKCGKFVNSPRLERAVQDWNKMQRRWGFSEVEELEVK